MKYKSRMDVFNPFIWDYTKEIEHDHKKVDDPKDPKKDEDWIKPDIFD